MDGSCKDGTMGSACCKFREEGADKCARVGREEEGTSSNRPELGGVVLALQSTALSEDALLMAAELRSDEILTLRHHTLTPGADTAQGAPSNFFFPSLDPLLLGLMQRRELLLFL